MNFQTWGMYELWGDIAIGFMAFCFGITVGSFLNVCIYRLPKGEGIIKRNSHCMTCGTEIKRYDLIPVISYLVLKGKCRACKSKISPRYMFVEALTGILFVFITLSHDFISDGLIYPAILCIFTAALIVIGFEDFDTKEMSISVLLFLQTAAVVTRILAELFPRSFRSYDIASLKECAIGMAAVSVPLLILGFVLTPLFYILFGSHKRKEVRKIKHRMKKISASDKNYKKLEKMLVSLKEEISNEQPVFGFGMGDVLLMASGGLMLGYKAVVTAAFFSVLSGGIYGIILIIGNKKKEDKGGSFAFGPFLAAGLIFAVFFGTKLFDLYVNSLMLGSVNR